MSAWSPKFFFFWRSTSHIITRRPDRVKGKRESGIATAELSLGVLDVIILHGQERVRMGGSVGCVVSTDMIPRLKNNYSALEYSHSLLYRGWNFWGRYHMTNLLGRPHRSTATYSQLATYHDA